MTISFVAATTSKATNLAETYTITKPSGVQSGDLMIAVVGCRVLDPVGQKTLTPPSGWTLKRTKYQSQSFPPQLDVLTRIAGASEPASWSGSYSSGNIGFICVVAAAYRGVDTISVEDVSGAGSGTSYDTAVVANSSASNWRLTAAACTSVNASDALAINEVIQRGQINHSDGTYGATIAGLWDSNGAIAAGNTSRTVSKGSTWHASASWIAILGPVDPGVLGDLAVTLPALAVSVAAQQGYEGPLALTLPQLSMTADGVASPPAGPLDVLILPTVDVVALHHAAGVLDVVVLPTMDAIGETRRFGIRVVSPEPELRVTRPRLGAVD